MDFIHIISTVGVISVLVPLLCIDVFGNETDDIIPAIYRRLHPALYILALAYRTLDLEDAKIRKQTVKDAVERNLYRILSWCKKLV